MDKGPWRLYFDVSMFGVASDDFKHDVVLRVSGDFGGEDKREYCELLATALNNATKMEQRVALLEAVAEAAENALDFIENWASYARQPLEKALRAAGYLKEQGE
jgi:hypothetical protein